MRNESENKAAARLVNGVSMAVTTNSTKCNLNWGQNGKGMCGQLKVDINGAEGPNVMGKDYFIFYILKDKIIPDDFRLDMWYNDCSFDKNPNDNYNGWGCTGWALEKGNLDYSRCSSNYLKTHSSCK